MSKIKFIYLSVFTLFAFLISCGSSDDSVEEPNTSISVICPDDILVNLSTSGSGAVVTYLNPQGSSNATLTQTEGLASGETFPVGTTTNTFSVTNASGNSTTCSFDVTVVENSGDNPFFIGNNPAPAGKQWSKVENLSDEFNSASFDDSKWHRNASTDGFNWIGRSPGLFKSENVSVSEGNLNVSVEKLSTPQTVNGNQYTHGGAIIRSKQVALQGQYYECRMKANSTVMSSTFWIAFKQNCSTGPVRKLELDIQECVGRVHSGTSSWATDYANAFSSNTWRHNRACDTEVTESMQSPGKTIMEEENNSRFFVYGCWWKSPTEILFYLDGVYTHSITPPTNFDLEGHITMAIETYNWNPVNDAGSLFETGSVDELTTKYDWVRTWKLEDE